MAEKLPLTNCFSTALAEIERLKDRVENLLHRMTSEEAAQEIEAWRSRFRALVDEDTPATAGNQVIHLQAEIERLKRELSEYTRRAVATEARLTIVEAAGQKLYFALRNARAKDAPIEILRAWRDAVRPKP